MQTQLTDLDGMIMRVRDPGSRDLIHEATVAYRGGALRSAVILCWVAVFNDLIAKVRELGQGGHKAALSYADELDGNIDNPQKALKFEREIVERATNVFLMFDNRDRILFERLREDRNACAHPILAGDSGHFKPTPELVRAHLAHALDRVLTRPPAQGKEALIRLWHDLHDTILPGDWGTAVALIYDRYIEHGTESLIRAVLKGAIRGLLLRADPFHLRDHPAYREVSIVDTRRGFIACLEAISRVERHLVEEATNDYLRSVEESRELPVQLTVLLAVSWRNELWERLSDPFRGQVIRMIGSHIEQMKNEPHDKTVRTYLAPALCCVSVPELRETLSSLIDMMYDTEFGGIVTFDHVPIELRKMLIGRFGSIRYFRGSERLFDDCIRPMLPYFDKSDVNHVIDVVVNNNQIWYASGMPGRIQVFFSWLWRNDRSKIDANKWSSFWVTMEEKIANDPVLADSYSGLYDDLVNAGIVFSSDAHTDQHSNSSSDDPSTGT